MAEQQTGNNQDKDSQGSENVQDIRNYYGRFETDDRYYNELGYLPSDDEQTLRMSEVNLPEERAKSGVQNAESTSCRKYLEFLKYAFEQLDREGRALKRAQNQGRPNWYLIPRTGNGGDENSTPLQSASHSDDEHANDNSAQVPAGTENLTVVKKDEIPPYPVETTDAMKTPDEDALLREHNKMFPCPGKTAFYISRRNPLPGKKFLRIIDLRNLIIPTESIKERNLPPVKETPPHPPRIRIRFFPARL